MDDNTQLSSTHKIIINDKRKRTEKQQKNRGYLKGKKASKNGKTNKKSTREKPNRYSLESITLEQIKKKSPEELWSRTFTKEVILNILRREKISWVAPHAIISIRM